MSCFKPILAQDERQHVFEHSRTHAGKNLFNAEINVSPKGCTDPPLMMVKGDFVQGVRSGNIRVAVTTVILEPLPGKAISGPICDTLARTNEPRIFIPLSLQTCCVMKKNPVKPEVEAGKVGEGLKAFFGFQGTCYVLIRPVCWCTIVFCTNCFIFCCLFIWCQGRNTTRKASQCVGMLDASVANFDEHLISHLISSLEL